MTFISSSFSWMHSLFVPKILWVKARLDLASINLFLSPFLISAALADSNLSFPDAHRKLPLDVPKPLPTLSLKQSTSSPLCPNPSSCWKCHYSPSLQSSRSEKQLWWHHFLHSWYGRSCHAHKSFLPTIPGTLSRVPTLLTSPQDSGPFPICLPLVAREILPPYSPAQQPSVIPFTCSSKSARSQGAP